MMREKRSSELDTGDKRVVSVYAIHCISICRLAFSNIVGLIEQVFARHASYVSEEHDVLNDNGNNGKHRKGAHDHRRRLTSVFLIYFEIEYGL